MKNPLQSLLDSGVKEEEELDFSIYKYIQDNGVVSREVLAREMNVSVYRIREWKKKYGTNGEYFQKVFTGEIPEEALEDTKLSPCKEGFTRETTDGGNTETMFSRSHSIRTIDDLLTYAKIRKEDWNIDDVCVNVWNGMYQIKCKLKRKVPVQVEDTIGNLISNLLAEKGASGPEGISNAQRTAENPHMLEVCLFDHHFGKLAWDKETGSDYDLDIASTLYHKAVIDLVDRSRGYNIEKIVFPIGNDFFHINNDTNTTKSGTVQDVDSRMAKIFETGYRAVIKAVEYCLTLGPVEILWVPGNHDWETSYYLAKFLESWYMNHSGVTVSTSPMSRKYVHYGTNLIGYTHGNEEAQGQLPVLMATEQKQAWAETTVREWHIGHTHKSKQVKYTAGDTFNGINVRVISSLAGTDAWHYKRGYTSENSAKAAEGFLWSKESGLTANFLISAESLLKTA